MKLASVLTPLSDENLTLAAQCGVDQIVVRYPGPDLSELNRMQQRIRSFGMEVGVVEGYLPIDRIKLGTDDGTDFSCQWLGYFKPTTTQTYTFYTSSDDASYMWIGSNAQSGFTTLNATVKNGGLHGQVEQSGTASLTAGTYYPIRIQFGERNGGDVMTFNYQTSTITKTTNVTGLVFYNPLTNGF